MSTPSSRRLGAICLALAALIAMGASGCRSVLFAKDVADAPEGVGADSVVRIFVDRNGDLYPSREVPIENSDVKNGIQYYFSSAEFRQRRDRGPAVSQAEFRSLCEYNALNGPAKDAAWLSVQESMWAAHARRISTISSTFEGKTRPIIIFLHGYKNEFREVKENYETLRTKLTGSHSLAGRKPVMVEAFWDGRDSSVELGVYRPAQPTASVVGFNLRQLLNGLSDLAGPDVPIRILGHSSGGIISAALVGNTTHAFPRVYPAGCTKRNQSINFRRYCAIPASDDPASPVRIPQLTDFRIGLLAAATPATSFTGRGSSPNGQAPGGIRTSNLALVLSANSSDWILTTSCFVRGLGGNSCLGRSKKNAANVWEHFGLQNYERGTALEATLIEFEGQRAHRFKSYMDNAAFERFLETTLGPIASTN